MLCILPVCCAAFLLVVTGCMFAARHYRMADQLCHFTAHIFWGALVLVLLTFFVRKNILITLLLLIPVIALTGYETLPWYIPVKNEGKEIASFRVCLINVLRRNTRYRDVQQFIRDTDPDICVMMEVDSGWTNALHDITAQYSHTIVSSELGNAGIMLVSCLPIVTNEEIQLSPKGRPNILCTLTIAGTAVDVYVAHPVSPTSREGKWEDRNTHVANLAQAIAASTNPVICIADLNTSMWSPFYKDFTKETALINARKGFGICGTYHAPTVLVAGIPIDHVLFSSAFRCTEFRTGPHIGSDHLPVWADITMNTALSHPK